MTDTTKERDLEVAIDSLKHSCLRLNKYQHRVTVDIEDVELVLTTLEAERQRADANEPVRCEGVPQHVHDMIDLQETIDELRTEIAALKGDQVPVAIGDDIIRDANRYRFLRDEDAWGEDSDSWDCDTRTGLISSENLMGGLSPDHFDDAIDARMAASDIPFLNPATAPQKPVGLRQIGSIDHDGGEFAEYFVEFTDSAQVGQAVYVIDSAIEAAGGIVAGHNDKVDITCWSCRRFITFQQHAEADGFCPHCSVEIELDDKDG